MMGCFGRFRNTAPGCHQSEPRSTSWTQQICPPWHSTHDIYQGCIRSLTTLFVVLGSIPFGVGMMPYIKELSSCRRDVKALRSCRFSHDAVRSGNHVWLCNTGEGQLLQLSYPSMELVRELELFTVKEHINTVAVFDPSSVWVVLHNLGRV
jgi:hypothetical protein